MDLKFCYKYIQNNNYLAQIVKLKLIGSIIMLLYIFKMYNASVHKQHPAW